MKKYAIKFRDGSTDDFEKGYDYYEKISAELANKFTEELKESIKNIEIRPLHYAVKYRKIRIAQFNNFPFSIHYIVEGSVIYILKILHQKRFYK